MPETDLASFDALCDERFDGWVDELRDFCTIPCETDQFAELDRGAGWVEQRLRAAGAEVTVLREEGVPPLVIGEMGAGPRTLIAVQHYDVQPAAPLDLWDTPPYDPQVRDGRLYARGVCDDKGELLHRIQAVEALRDANGELPCRVRFIIEGEEESDSAHLAPLLSRRPELFEADGALIEGGGVDEKGRPLLVCGVRGMFYVELAVRTLAFDAHSGGAQLFPNAAWRLIQALDTLRSPDGAILVDGYMDDVLAPTEAQLAHLRTLPFEEEEIKRIYGVEQFVGEFLVKRAVADQQAEEQRRVDQVECHLEIEVGAHRFLLDRLQQERAPGLAAAEYEALAEHLREFAVVLRGGDHSRCALAKRGSERHRRFGEVASHCPKGSSATGIAGAGLAFFKEGIHRHRLSVGPVSINGRLTNAGFKGNSFDCHAR